MNTDNGLINGSERDSAPAERDQASPEKKAENNRNKSSNSGRLTKPKLNPKQQEFVIRYCDPTGPSYKNASRSYALSHPNANQNTAKVAGHDYLQNPTIRSEIEAVFASQGMDRVVVAARLAQILKGSYRITSTTKDKDGKVCASTETSPRPADVIKAADLYFRVTGIRDAAKAAVDLAKDKELLKLIHRQGLPSGSAHLRRGRGD